jgi:hypothetical protein
MIKFLLALITGMFTGKAANPAQPQRMNEGDYHSGPHGYSPNTAYPKTEYGNADWESEHH